MYFLLTQGKWMQLRINPLSFFRLTIIILISDPANENIIKEIIILSCHFPLNELSVND